MRNKIILFNLLFILLLLPSSIYSSSSSSGNVTYSKYRETSTYSYNFKAITKPAMEKVSIFNPTLATYEKLYNVPAFKVASATFRVLDNINEFGIIEYNIAYYTHAYISENPNDLIYANTSNQNNTLDTLTLYEKVSYYDYEGLKKIEWIKPNDNTYFFSKYEKVTGGYINIDYYYVVDNPSNYSQGKDLYIYIKHIWSGAYSLIYNFVDNYNTPFGNQVVNTAIDENEIYPVGSIPTSYSINANTLNVNIFKIFSNTGKIFFNDNIHEYYRISLNPLRNGLPLAGDFKVGLYVSSQHNFNLHLEDKTLPKSDEKIPYKLYIKNGRSTFLKLVDNNERFLITGISRYSDDIILSVKTELNGDLYKKEGIYKDTIYLNFVTDATISSTDTTINL